MLPYVVANSTPDPCHPTPSRFGGARQDAGQARMRACGVTGAQEEALLCRRVLTSACNILRQIGESRSSTGWSEGFITSTRHSELRLDLSPLTILYKMAAATVGRVGDGISQRMMGHRHPSPPRIDGNTRQLVLLLRHHRLALVRLWHVAHTLWHIHRVAHMSLHRQTQRKKESEVSILGVCKRELASILVVLSVTIHRHHQHR